MQQAGPDLCVCRQPHRHTPPPHHHHTHNPSECRLQGITCTTPGAGCPRRPSSYLWTEPCWLYSMTRGHGSAAMLLTTSLQQMPGCASAHQPLQHTPGAFTA